jgi:hypothetical protein
MDIKVIDDNGIVLAHEKLDPTKTVLEFDLDIGGAQQVTVEAEGSLSGNGKVFVAGYYK